MADEASSPLATMAARTVVPSHNASASRSVGNARGCCTVAGSRAFKMVSVGPAVARIRVPAGVESIPIQIGRIVVLLAARDRCVMHRGRQRRRDLYDRGQVLGSLMRHLRGLDAVEVPLLASGVVGPAGRGPLIALARLALRGVARQGGADPGAVGLPVVAEAAQEEELPAGPAGDEAQRVHGSGRDRQELDADREPCEEGPRRARLWATT